MRRVGGAGTVSNGPLRQPSVEGGLQEAAEEGGSHFVSELFGRAGEIKPSCVDVPPWGPQCHCVLPHSSRGVGVHCPEGRAWGDRAKGN